MVAISMYRGNLHRVPQDVPRRWAMPTSRIPPKDFRRILLRRAHALSLLPSSSSSPPEDSAVAVVKEEDVKVEVDEEEAEGVVEGGGVKEEVKEEGRGGGVDEQVLVCEKSCMRPSNFNLTGNDQVPVCEGNDKSDLDDKKEKRKREVEEKLNTLNEKKHNLVKALKQILNAEEELKRRSNVQANRPPLPLQVDASNDSGSMTRHLTPRTGSEANVNVDMEIGDGDDALNHNPQSRLLRMSSTSPCAESALRRPPYFQHTLASHPTRGSPSRFAPSGNQGNTPNLPTVSVTGTNYIASSPSPAASGGTSGFRDARHPSPWN